jgi:hypothetical protein
MDHASIPYDGKIADGIMIRKIGMKDQRMG